MGLRRRVAQRRLYAAAHPNPPRSAAGSAVCSLTRLCAPLPVKNAPTWLCKYGIAVASIEQRPITETGWPAQIDDPRDALAFLRSHADEFGIDPARFGVFGGSSGGHLVALLGTTSNKINTPESAVQAVCDWFGPTDLLTMPPNTLGFGKDLGRVRTMEDLSTSNGAVMLGAYFLLFGRFMQFSTKISALWVFLVKRAAI